MDGIEKLSTVRGFLLDMDGTFYLDDRLLEGALRFIGLLSEQSKEFLFLTNNSSKHRRQYAQKISRLGLPIAEESVLTSGEATALYLKEQNQGADIFLVGTPSLEDEFRQHGFHLVQQEPQFLVLGFDTTLTYQKLWALCDFVRAGIPYIATHPDFNCPTRPRSLRLSLTQVGTQPHPHESQRHHIPKHNRRLHRRIRRNSQESRRTKQESTTRRTHT